MSTQHPPAHFRHCPTHHPAGNNCTACFCAEEDDRRYLDTLREQAQKHDCRARLKGECRVVRVQTIDFANP